MPPRSTATHAERAFARAFLSARTWEMRFRLLVKDDLCAQVAFRRLLDKGVPPTRVLLVLQAAGDPEIDGRLLRIINEGRSTGLGKNKKTKAFFPSKYAINQLSRKLRRKAGSAASRTSSRACCGTYGHAHQSRRSRRSRWPPLSDEWCARAASAVRVCICERRSATRAEAHPCLISAPLGVLMKQTKPWEAVGMSRSSWSARQAN